MIDTRTGFHVLRWASGWAVAADYKGGGNEYYVYFIGDEAAPPMVFPAKYRDIETAHRAFIGLTR